MSIETLKLALETAEGIANSNWRKWEELASSEEFERWAKSRANHMATTLRQAIEQAQQAQQAEPVMWMMPDGKTVDKWGLQFYGGQVGKPLYTTPPQRKPLSDEEITTLRHKIDWTASWSYVEFARAIETKLKEK